MRSREWLLTSGWFGGALGQLRDPKVSLALTLLSPTTTAACGPGQGRQGFLLCPVNARPLFASRGAKVSVWRWPSGLFSSHMHIGELFVCAAGEWTRSNDDVWFTNTLLLLPRPRQLKSVIAARLHAIEPGSGSPATPLSQVLQRAAPQLAATSHCCYFCHERQFSMQKLW